MKRYLLNEMKRYLTLVPDASEEEISDLKKWVAEGNSPYANPWYIADERGTELRVYPKFCVNSKSRCKIEQKILFRGLSPLSTL